jgi:hypothetical protein
MGFKQLVPLQHELEYMNFTAVAVLHLALHQYPQFFLILSRTDGLQQSPFHLRPFRLPMRFRCKRRFESEEKCRRVVVVPRASCFVPSPISFLTDLTAIAHAFSVRAATTFVVSNVSTLATKLVRAMFPGHLPRSDKTDYAYCIPHASTHPYPLVFLQSVWSIILMTFHTLPLHPLWWNIIRLLQSTRSHIAFLLPPHNSTYSIRILQSTLNTHPSPRKPAQQQDSPCTGCCMEYNTDIAFQTLPLHPLWWNIIRLLQSTRNHIRILQSTLKHTPILPCKPTQQQDSFLTGRCMEYNTDIAFHTFQHAVWNILLI